jgi:hypothetical protein
MDQVPLDRKIPGEPSLPVDANRGDHPPGDNDGLSPELVASMVLQRAHGGGVAKAGDRYLDGGFPTPGYLAGAFDELTVSPPVISTDAAA